MAIVDMDDLCIVQKKDELIEVFDYLLDLHDLHCFRLNSKLKNWYSSCSQLYYSMNLCFLNCFHCFVF